MELRDLDDARRYVLQGLWLGRVARPQAATVAPVLGGVNAIVGNGDPLPPVGFVADLGHIAFGLEAGAAKDHATIPGWSPALADNYHHHVLGKFYADANFERASYAILRYEGKDRARGLAFIAKQFRERAKHGGVEFSNAVVRTLIQANPNELLAEGYESFARDGPHPLLAKQYEELISASRKLSEVLGPEPTRRKSRQGRD